MQNLSAWLLFRWCRANAPEDFGALHRSPKGCAFCNASAENGFDIVNETDTVVVFRDRSPGAKEHLLAIPKYHKGSIKTLNASDVPMREFRLPVSVELSVTDALGQPVRDLYHQGRLALESFDINPTLQRFGFHIPPFSSVPHLHLHCIGLPLRSSFRALKYRLTGDARRSIDREGRDGRPQRKGWGWFIEVHQAIATLERGEKVRIASSK